MAFIDDVLQVPSYGWKDENGNLVTLTPEYIYSLPDKDKQEEYHQRNRRTAFFVLEQN